MKGLLSIIVPVYQVEKFLRQCVNSILAQTYDDFELILVDDGSKDSCPEICDDYSRKDSRVRVIHQNNAGLSAARNAGLDIAQGEWIGFVDSDDWVSPNFFHVAVNTMLAHPEVDVVELPMLQAFNTSKAKRYAPSDGAIATTAESIFSLWFSHQGYDHAFAQTKLYRSPLFKDLRFSVGKVFEDILLIPHILERSQGWTYCGDPRATYYYRQHQHSITATAKAAQMLTLIQGHELIAQRAQRNALLTAEERQRYAIYLSNRLIDYLKACRREGLSGSIPPVIKDFININRPTLLELLRLPITLHEQFKNIPLALLGSQLHSAIYSAI